MRRAVLVVCDSLRADMIDAAIAPTLTALGDGATRFAAARGVFPSVTRVTSASVATGCYPGRHGLLGNTMVIDEGRGLGAPQQGLAGLPLRGGVERFEELHPAARQHRDRQPVAIEQAVAGERGEPRPGRDEPDEVERIGT